MRCSVAPSILLLDEPTTGLDPQARHVLWDRLFRLKETGVTLVITTHYMDEAEHCDRMALIIAGKIIALDTPSALKAALPYSVWSLRVERFIEVFEEVAALPFVEEAAIFGSDIHIMTKKGFPLKRELAGAFKVKGIKGFSIEEVGATLEDVFVSHAARLGV